MRSIVETYAAQLSTSRTITAPIAPQGGQPSEVRDRTWRRASGHVAASGRLPRRPVAQSCATTSPVVDALSEGRDVAVGSSSIERAERAFGMFDSLPTGGWHAVQMSQDRTGERDLNTLLQSLEPRLEDVVAARNHDHLFVPYEDARRALGLIEQLSVGANTL